METISYVHTDHLGSIIGLTDELGQVIPGSVNSFDAWGRRRDPNTWQIISNFSQPLLFDRGFTGHEHLTEFNLINMNGRVYDPTIMRFLSPDPIIQAPDFSQSFNRYSYVMNNPINLIDLSGYTWEDYEDDPPHVTDAEFREQNKDGFWLAEVEVIDSKMNPMEEIWKMHDGFELDREYDGYDAENNRGSTGGSELQLNSTASYIYDGQFRSYPLIHSMEAGQHVRVEVKNMNFLGVQLDLQDKSRYTYKKNWLGIESKVYTGDSHSMVLLPIQSKSFDFYMFNYVPMNWQFELSTKISGAANVQIRFYSDWVPGMPYDPIHPNR
ncbi:MAG: RHS repeat-associated core domain-containing protein [Bacteroidales bacterium]|nr:RHS repeat-associated core domain-containing protein [Bacteroidales bacterium]MDZ4204660.1 RHS repeat-associated core domain-containing protein [Bacteroidales bacterium]